ncbi:hypothetical protein ACNOYE_02765 [Nannocystaceae bacterium ST9]
MSHHDHDCEHEHHHHAHEHAAEPAQAGGPDTRFLDLEISKVLFDEAEGITRKAFRELLEEAAKRHWLARYGQRIDALARLAVDQLIADIEANQRIEATIAERERSRGDLDARVQAILAGGETPSE